MTRLWIFISVLPLVLLLVAPAHTQDARLPGAADPALAPGDEIDLSVFARPELSRSYRVRADGTVSLHIVGPVPAEGLTAGALEDAIEDALSERFDGQVSATVEVSRWRPVTVAGAVTTPGAVAFVPGLDVRMAVALAGGAAPAGALEGETAATRMRVQQEAALAAQLKVQLAALLSERDRIAAQRIESPPPPPSDAVIDLIGVDDAHIIARSQDALGAAQARSDALALAAGRTQEALATEEAKAFVARQEVVKSQLDTTQEELARQESLLERGLARSSGLLDLRLDMDRLRADELEAVGLAAAARQKVDRAASGRSLAEAEREQVATVRLAELTARIAELRAQLEGSERFVRDFGGAELLRDGTTSPARHAIYRREGGTVGRSAASPDTRLMPGDVLEVLFSSEEDR